MAVVTLCHICHRPTLESCRNCGRPACDEHMVAGGICLECAVGRRSRPGIRA